MKLGINIMHNEWKNMLLEECIIGKAACGANIKAEEYDPTLPRYLRITNIDNDGNLIAYSIKSIRPLDAKKSYLQKGDIVFARSGSIGKTYLHRTNETLAYAGYLIRLRPNHNIILPEYLFLITQSNQYKTLIKHTIQGAVQCNINVQEYLKLSISVPPLSEQQKIASILRTWDKAIEKLKKLIKCKEIYLEKLIHQMLTQIEQNPNTAFLPLGEILIYEQPTKYIVKTTDYFKNGEVAVLTANQSFILGYTTEKEGIFDHYPVIIFDDFTTDSKYVDFLFKVKSSAIKMLLPKNNKINLSYIHMAMSQIQFPKGGHKRYWISEYQFLEIPLPDFKKQQYVAHIFNTAKQEIYFLKKLSLSYYSQKQGLMQKLLTGQWRVKMNEEKI